MADPVIRTALDLPIIDLGAFYASPQVEGALQEIGGGGGGGGASFAKNAFTPTVGQTVFTLSATFVGIGGLVVATVNGLVYEKDVDYTIAGTTFTWLDVPFTLETTDCLVVVFQTT